MNHGNGPGLVTRVKGLSEWYTVPFISFTSVPAQLLLYCSHPYLTPLLGQQRFFKGVPHQVIVILIVKGTLLKLQKRYYFYAFHSPLLPSPWRIVSFWHKAKTKKCLERFRSNILYTKVNKISCTLSWALQHGYLLFGDPSYFNDQIRDPFLDTITTTSRWTVKWAALSSST